MGTFTVLQGKFSIYRVSLYKDFSITAQSGARGTSDEKVKYYNLDAIISIGYRVNSFRATIFRIWATQVLKQYMLKGFAVNRNAVSEQKTLKIV